MNDQRLYSIRYRFPGTETERKKLPGQLIYASDPDSAVAILKASVSKRNVPTSAVTIVRVERFTQDRLDMQIPRQAGLL